MALYQDGILISGANQLPQMTLAEWQALPSAERPTYWICTDRDYEDMSVVFTEASTRANINSGETLPTLFGKIKKFFSDLKTHAFTALDQNSIDIGGMAGGQQYVYAKGVNDFSYNNGVIQISKRTGYNSYDTELIPIPTDFVSKENGGTFKGLVTIDLQNGGADQGNAWSYITLGNSIAKGTAKHSAGYVRFYGHGSKFTDFYAPDATANHDIVLPDKGGTVALTSDIPDISTKVSKSGDTMSGVLNVSVSGTDTPLSLQGNSANGTFIAMKNNAGTIMGYLYGRNNSRGGFYYGGAYHDFAYLSEIETDYASSLRIEAQGSYRFQYNLYSKSGAPLSSGQVTISTSSRKFKKNIAPLSEDDARKILDVETVTFDYKKDHDNYTSRKGYKNIGCIAEDVNEIIPEVVIEDENDEIFGINYIEMIPYLIKMVQIQQKEIEELKAIIKANE